MDPIALMRRSHLMRGDMPTGLSVFWSYHLACLLRLLAPPSGTVHFRCWVWGFCVFVFEFLSRLSYCRCVGFCSCLPTEEARAPALLCCPTWSSRETPPHVLFVDNSSPFSTILPHESVIKPDDPGLPHPTNTWINSFLTGCRRDWPSKHLRPAASARAPCRAACWVPCCTLFTRMTAPLLTTPAS